MKIDSVLFLLFVSSSFSVSVGFSDVDIEDIDEENEIRCFFNFSSHEINSCYNSETICARVFTEELTYEEARVRCSILLSQLTQRIYLNSTLYSELKSRGIGLLWVGIHRKANFFITEYPSKPFREASIYSDFWGYNWSDEEPGLEDCVALNISTGSLETHDCESHLPFVCQDDGKHSPDSVKDLCPTDWILSVPLSASNRTCIGQHKPASLVAAERTCYAQGGNLATLEEYAILYGSDYHDSMLNKKYWTKKEHEGVCSVIILDFDYVGNEIVPTDCRDRYDFICVKHHQPEVLRVRVSPNTLPPVSSEDSDWIDILSCQFEAFSYNGTALAVNPLYQWYKNDVPIASKAHYLLKLSYVGDGLKRGFSWDIAARQGYYHCEVRVDGSPQTYLSQKVKLSFSDISTFTVFIRNITYSNLLDYSNIDFTEIMEELEDTVMSNVVEQLNHEYLQVFWDFDNASVEYEHITMKIIFYIYRADPETFDKRMACEEIKQALDEQQSVPTYMGNPSFDIDCKDFADMSGYYRFTKTLKAFNSKLERIEETQSEILEKFESLGNVPRVNRLSRPRNFDEKAIFILGAALKLEQLKRNLLSILLKDTQVDDASDEIERNYIDENRLLYDRYLLESKIPDLIESGESIPPLRSRETEEIQHMHLPEDSGEPEELYMEREH